MQKEEAIRPQRTAAETPSSGVEPPSFVRRRVLSAWVPWILLSALVFVWGIPAFKTTLDDSLNFRPGHFSAPTIPVPGLHNVVLRAPPVVPPPSSDRPTRPEEALYRLNWLSATGTGILVSAVSAGLLMGFSLRELLKTYRETVVRVRYSLITIAAMLALGYVTKYSG